MSEFFPTTTASFYETFTPFDDYDEPESPVGVNPVLTEVPISILETSVNQHQPVGNRGTTVKTYEARVRGHHAVELDYLIEDERTGVRYSIDDMDKDSNPVGDDSWVMSLRKVPTTPGQ